MALPVLLLMFVLIMSVGVFSMGYLKATVTARSNSFEQRTSRTSQLPMAYLSQTSKGDVRGSSATESPTYPSPKINFGQVTASHSVLGGSWDHRELLKGNGPHWEDMGKASLGGGANQISSLLNQFSNLFDAGAIPGIGEMAGGLLEQLLGAEDEANSAMESENNSQKEKAKEERARLQKRIDDLRAERMTLQNELDNTLYPKRNMLQDDIEKREEAIDEEENADKKKALEEEQKADKEDLKKTNEQIQQKENRIKAIDAEIDATQGIIDRLDQL